MLIYLCSRAVLLGALVLAATGCTPGSPAHPVVPADKVALAVGVDRLATNHTTPRLTGTMNEAGTVSVTVAGVTYAATNNGDGTWTLAQGLINPPLAAGVYDVSVSAVDAAGHVGNDVATGALTIDLTAPQVSVNALTTNLRRPQITGTTDDPTATVTVKAGSLSLGTAANHSDGTWSLTSAVDVPDGAHTLAATARDPAGNSTEASAQLTLDATAPVVTVDVLATADTTPPMSGTVDDPAVVVHVTVARNTYTASNVAGKWMIADGVIAPPLAVGWYDVGVTAVDAFGNVATNLTPRGLRITEAPLVYTSVIAADNLSLLITFDQGVYGDAAHSVPIGLGRLEPDLRGKHGRPGNERNDDRDSQRRRRQPAGGDAGRGGPRFDGRADAGPVFH